MRATFPFRHMGQGKFGDIWRPYAPLLVRERGTANWTRRVLVVDTGADYTLFPKRDAAIFGIDINKDCIPETTFGVGGVETVYLYKALEVKFSGETKKIPVGFLGKNDIPALLGRQGFLELFKVTFGQKESIFET